MFGLIRKRFKVDVFNEDKDLVGTRYVKSLNKKRAVIKVIGKTENAESKTFEVSKL